MTVDVAYCCFADQNNLGDYALFLANQKLFPQFQLHSHEHESNPSVNLFGGGTLYPYAIRYGWFERRAINVSIGMGVSDPEFDGSFGFLTRRAMRRWTFHQYGVRGYRSKQILAANSIASEVTGDTALAHEPRPNFRRKEGLVAINLVGEEMRRRGSHNLVFEELLALCHKFIAHGLRIRLIPFCVKDVQALKQLNNEVGERAEIVDYWSSPPNLSFHALLESVHECSLVVGERLHSVVLAAAMGVPFISIGYKPKCFDFANSLVADTQLVEPAAICRDDLFNRSLSLLHDNNTAGEINERVREYRRRLTTTAKSISDYVVGKSCK